MRKILPYLLLVALMFIAIFIVGVRYGRNVEKQNKTIDYIISQKPASPTPTKLPPSPTSAPIQFKTYDHAGCGVSVVHPSTFEKLIESSDEASLGQNKAELSFKCAKRLVTAPTPTIEEQVVISFQDKQVFAQKLEKADGSYYQFQVVHTRTGDIITFTISRDVYPLVERSIRFFRPT